MDKYIVLGGSSGIGKSIAKKCLENSKEVIISGRSKDKLKNSLNDLVEFGKVSKINIDLGNLDDVTYKSKILSEDYGNIDGLVINGPLPPLKEFKSCSLEDWTYATNSTILASVILIKKLLPIFNKNSSIIFILSDTCRAAGNGKSISVSLRLALSGLMKSLAIEYADTGLRFNAVSPGPTLTKRAERLFENGAKKEKITYEEFKNKFIETLPSKRLIRPEEIADLVYYLLVNNSLSLTGTNIPFDGGLTQIPL